MKADVPKLPAPPKPRRGFPKIPWGVAVAIVTQMRPGDSVIVRAGHLDSIRDAARRHAVPIYWKRTGALSGKYRVTRSTEAKLDPYYIPNS